VQHIVSVYQQAAQTYLEKAQQDMATLLMRENPALGEDDLLDKVVDKVNQSTDHLLTFWKWYETTGLLGAQQLAQVAKRVLSIQGSSGAPERVFSRGGLVISKLRTRLKPTMAGPLIMADINKRNITRDHGDIL
jgi:beta-galactosidase/beta-glucuronidase